MNEQPKNKIFDCPAKQAFLKTDGESRRKGFYMLGAAGVTLCVCLLSRLLYLFKPLFDMAFYGIVTPVFYYVSVAAVFVVYAVLLNRFLKRRFGYRLFALAKAAPPDRQSYIRAALVIVICAVTVLCCSAYFSFRLKIQSEMGFGVTLSAAIINALVYIYYGLHMWMGFIAAKLVQDALSALFPAPRYIPYGAIFLVAVFGTIELVLELYTTTHLYGFIYYIFTYCYAAVFVLAKDRLHLSFWISAAVMIL